MLALGQTNGSDNCYFRLRKTCQLKMGLLYAYLLVLFASTLTTWTFGCFLFSVIFILECTRVRSLSIENIKILVVKTQYIHDEFNSFSIL